MNNVEAYREKGYKIKSHPFRVLYNYWYGGGLPVAGSEMVCLDLMDFALEAGLKLGVHYCSLENKHTGQIYKQNAGRKLPKRMHRSQKDYFLKSAKVFGEDAFMVRQVFDRAEYRDYAIHDEYNSLEFHVNQIGSLKKLDIDNKHSIFLKISRRSNMFHMSSTELIIVLVIVILLFGVGRIGKIAGELGKGVRDFQTGLKGEEKTEVTENKG
jgi:TatA/E family protein of Tat protein translocase